MANNKMRLDPISAWLSRASWLPPHAAATTL